LTTWFTSDTHFSHANVIEFCGRPFANVEEMDREMVARWNARVQPGDTVYHLGDFAFGPYENIGKFLAQLNGDIHLVLGNHDRSQKRMEQCGFAGVYLTLHVYADDGRQLFLSHKPFDMPAGAAPVIDFYLHGHVHDRYARRGNQINVGVDVRGFAPATLEELLATPESLIPQAS
jgi:calcineurin-like phosphoesterase family protein